MKKTLFKLVLFLMVATLPITGCGGGDGGGGGTTTISGVAATGTPIVGTVSLKDSAVTPKEITTNTDANGAFSMTVDGLTPPFLLKAVGTAGGTSHTLYSFSAGPGIANVNPLSHLAVLSASGLNDLTALYATPDKAKFQQISSSLSQVTADIQTELQPMLDLYSAHENIISGSYKANHQGLDGLFDMVKVTFNANTVTITNKANSAVIFTASCDGIKSGTYNNGNVPLPPIAVSVLPETATVLPGGTINFTATVTGTANIGVTWSVVQVNGGTINSTTGVYTAPSANGTYTIKATSVVDTSKNDTATITVAAVVPVSVSLTPSSTSVNVNGTAHFNATVAGTSNTQVTFSVVEANGGSITQNGDYTAPAAAGTYHVKATSVADSSKTATATVTVKSIAAAFPIGTWVSSKGFTIIISKKELSSGGVDYYSGSIKYPFFVNQTIDSFGTLIPTMTNGAGATIMGGIGSSGSYEIGVSGGESLFSGSDLHASSFQVQMKKYSDITGTGFLIVTSTDNAAVINESNAIFARQ